MRPAQIVIRDRLLKFQRQHPEITSLAMSCIDRRTLS
jgi:hypothetical protein